MAAGSIRVGFVGAGYIATWHAAALAAAAPQARLVAVADPATEAAEALAAAHGARAYPSLEAMLAGAPLDAVHILTPPPLHAAQALAALAAGAHVLVEKPFALTAAEAEGVAEAAAAAGRIAAVNHNFLGLPAHARLRRALEAGLVGRIDAAEIHWRLPLPPLRAGPFGLWMLRSPANLVTELAPHPLAFACDVLGPLGEVALATGRPIALPGGAVLPQTWRLTGRAGGAEVLVAVSLVEGLEARTVTLRGVAGTATLDYGRDTLVIERANTAGLVAEPLLRELSLAAQHLREGVVNATRQLRSLNRRAPYALGFAGAVGAFHAAIAAGRPVEPRFSAAAAVTVARAVDAAVACLPPPAAPAPAPAPAPASGPATALVIGGTGFIGRALVRALVAGGERVRVASRGRANPFADLGDAVELVAAPPSDPAALARAMAGVRTVYHLAKAEEATWEGYLKHDVAVAEATGAAALAAGVARFVYAGTVACYDASDPFRPIDEDTPFGPMEARNLYARSKALCEERLRALHRDRGLPLVIARPGIVVGPGGPLQHWGLGRWNGAGAVMLWGTGRAPLPFVLVEDVADGLRRCGSVPGIEGQSFNLVGDPLLSARDYLDAIARLTGTRIRVRSGNPTLLWLADAMKWALKRRLLGRRDATRATRADWRSRALLSPFRNARAKAVLGWSPEADRDRLAARAIDHPGLFGF
jgi:predicted dehydrogenase/nucleoside-diphosphate-sugar epimerase